MTRSKIVVKVCPLWEYSNIDDVYRCAADGEICGAEAIGDYAKCYKYRRLKGMLFEEFKHEISELQIPMTQDHEVDLDAKSEH